jgi:hypothetical protein
MLACWTVDSPSPSGLGPNKVHCKEDEVINRNSQINDNKKTQFKQVYESLAIEIKILAVFWSSIDLFRY